MADVVDYAEIVKNLSLVSKKPVSASDEQNIKVPGLKTQADSDAKAQVSKLANTLREVSTKYKDSLKQLETTVSEQGDLIEQLQGTGMKLFGVAIEVNPDRFTAEDFPKGSVVRVVRGQYAGSFGTIESEIDAENGSATISISGVKPTSMRIIRKFVNPTMYRSMTDEEPLVDPEPADYRIGAFIKGEDDKWLKIVNEVDRIGNIQVINQDDSSAVPQAMSVGEDVLIAPGNRKAGTIFVALDGRIVECQIPRRFEVKRGHVVAINPQTLEIVSTSGKVSYGETVFFSTGLEDGTCEVNVGSQQSTKVVYSLVDPNTLEKGDRVSLDSTHQVIVRVLPREMKVCNYTGKTGVQWSDIGGLEAAKSALRATIEQPVLYADIYEFYEKRHSRGMVLSGPPGCGKTELARAASTAIVDAHGGVGRDSAFIYLKGPEVLSQWVGAAEAMVRRIFQAARDHYLMYGYPAIVFIDEADAVLGKRGTSRSSDVDKTIVAAFLAEWDGLDDTPFFMLLATNRVDALDPAIMRDGRIDRKIEITRPDPMAAAQIANIHLGKKPLSGQLRDILRTLVEELFDETRVLCDIVYGPKETDTLTMKDIVSGAMIRGIVEKACEFAIERDIAAGSRTGICQEDVTRAVELTYQENHNVNLDDEIKARVGDRVPSGIKRRKKIGI